MSKVIVTNWLVSLVATHSLYRNCWSVPCGRYTRWSSWLGERGARAASTASATGVSCRGAVWSCGHGESWGTQAEAGGGQSQRWCQGEVRKHRGSNIISMYLLSCDFRSPDKGDQNDMNLAELLEKNENLQVHLLVFYFFYPHSHK